jgi:hypothetical protein
LRYLWYNGYIPANLINKPNGIMGIPANYVPVETPLYPTPASGGTNPNYETNNVFITLKNGSVVQTQRVQSAGLNQPLANGISSLQTSAKAARQIQLTLPLFW